jgi:hypothetical protein
LADLATGAHADVSKFTEDPATTAAMVATGAGAWWMGKKQLATMAEQAAKRQAAQEALLQQPRPLPKYNGGAQLTNQAEIDAWDQAQREAQKKADGSAPPNRYSSGESPWQAGCWPPVKP